MSSGFIRNDQLLQERRRELASSILRNAEELMKRAKLRTYQKDLEELRGELGKLKEKARSLTYMSETELYEIRDEAERITRKLREIRHLEATAEELAKRLGKIKIELKPVEEKKAKIDWKIEIEALEGNEENLKNWLLNSELAKIKNFLTIEQLLELKKTKDLKELQRKIIEYSTEMETLRDKAEFLIKEYAQASVLDRIIDKIKKALKEGKFSRLKELINSAEEILEDEKVQKAIQLEKELREKLPDYEIAFEKDMVVIYGDNTRAEVIVGEEIEINAFQPTASFCENIKEFTQTIGARWEEKEQAREMERERG